MTDLTIHFEVRLFTPFHDEEKGDGYTVIKKFEGEACDWLEKRKEAREYAEGYVADHAAKDLDPKGSKVRVEVVMVRTETREDTEFSWGGEVAA